MEIIRKESGDTRRSLTDRINQIEEELSIGEMKKITKEEKKDWKFPFKWKRQFNKSRSKMALDKILVIYLNIKSEIEPPVLVPLFSGNIIIYKNKAHEFDPRAVLTIRIGKKIIRCILIKETDRRAVSNLDYDEIKKRGDSTDSDEILVKMIVKAIIEKTKKKVSMGIVILIGVAIIAAIIVFFVFMK